MRLRRRRLAGDESLAITEPALPVSAASPVLLLPVKRLDAAKSRLAGLRQRYERRGLVLAMLADVTSAALRAGLHPRVLTPDPAVMQIVGELGATASFEPAGAGSLNQALAHEVKSLPGVASVLIVLPDVPLIQAEDFLAMMEASRDRTVDDPAVLLWPDRRRRGTNAMLVRPPDGLSPAFGPNSFARHLAIAADSGVTTRVMHAPRVALDVDTRGDVVALLERRGAPRTRRFLQRLGIEERLASRLSHPHAPGAPRRPVPR
jgi:2-phospho-L-lactate/phosphoenolpyruvate guanylyltransferase